METEGRDKRSRFLSQEGGKLLRDERAACFDRKGQAGRIRTDGFDGFKRVVGFLRERDDPASLLKFSWSLWFDTARS